MRTSLLSRGAICLTLSLVFFFLFRGLSNILNAVLLPLTLLWGIFPADKKESGAIILAVVLLTLLFARMQLFFLISYILMALLLKYSLLKGFTLRIIFVLTTLINYFGFYLGTALTDIVLGTRIQKILLVSLGNNVFYYHLLLFFEGVLVALALIGALKLLLKKDLIFKADKRLY